MFGVWCAAFAVAFSVFFSILDAKRILSLPRSGLRTKERRAGGSARERGFPLRLFPGRQVERVSLFAHFFFFPQSFLLRLFNRLRGGFEVRRERFVAGVLQRRLGCHAWGVCRVRAWGWRRFGRRKLGGRAGSGWVGRRGVVWAGGGRPGALVGRAPFRGGAGREGRCGGGGEAAGGAKVEMVVGGLGGSGRACTRRPRGAWGAEHGVEWVRESVQRRRVWGCGGGSAAGCVGATG